MGEDGKPLFDAHRLGKPGNAGTLAGGVGFGAGTGCPEHKISEWQSRGNGPVHRCPVLYGLQIPHAALSGQPEAQGWKLWHQRYACNRYVTGGKTACSGHIINQRVLIELLLIDIRFKAALAQNQPNALKEKIMAQKNAAGLEEQKTLQATMDALDKRLTELEKLVVAACEDKVKGAIPEAVCDQLLKRYEDERMDKPGQRTKLSAQLDVCQGDEQTADDWLVLIRDYSKLEELDRPPLLRLVKRIEVGECKTVNGHDERDIKIYYNFVSFVKL